MATTEIRKSSSARPLRLWPGVVLVAIIVAARFIMPAIVPNTGILGVLVALAGGAVVLLWWLFFSRAPWIERIGALLLILVAGLLTRFVVHPSIAGGMMGYMLPVFLLPATVAPMLVAWAAVSRRFSGATRWLAMVVAIAIGCGVWILVRTDGIMGEADPQLAWRWTPTAEERLLAATRDETLPQRAAPVAPTETASPTPAPPPPDKVAAPAVTATPAPASAAAGEPSAPPKPEPRAAVAPPAVTPILWSGFRGGDRDAVLDGVRINTDWNATPPTEIWRHRIGPGWSSFAVAGDLIFTQEQRGDHELISAYRLSTGAPVWRHQDDARFYESNGGPGPRGTPTVHDGRVYAMGATGIVNALDAATGARLWTRNAQADTGAPLPGWGFTASPIVVNDLLVTATSGRLAAYDLTSGTPRWTRTTGGGGYSSPQLATIHGVPQVLLANGGGITSVGLDGVILWNKNEGEAVGIVQPRVLDDGSVLVAPGDAMGGLGLRRLLISRDADGGWKVDERWTSRGLKPYFNDYVVHEGHAYGFDGTILSAINLETGERVWKGGRYGAGQMLLLPEQDLLLVQSEDGDLVLVAATPEKHTEIAKSKAIEGKSWNHPVVVGNVVLVRNGEEMAAFRLPR